MFAFDEVGVVCSEFREDDDASRREMVDDDARVYLNEASLLRHVSDIMCVRRSGSL